MQNRKTPTLSQHTFSMHLDLMKLQTKSIWWNKTEQKYPSQLGERKRCCSFALPMHRKTDHALIPSNITMISDPAKIIFSALTVTLVNLVLQMLMFIWLGMLDFYTFGTICYGFLHTYCDFQEQANRKRFVQDYMCSGAAAWALLRASDARCWISWSAREKHR